MNWLVRIGGEYGHMVFQGAEKEVLMPGYQPISVAAAGLMTDKETLLDFHRKGWVQAVERSNTVFLAADQRYRAKYILHLLETRHLSDAQIQLVLSIQRPPYSAAEVDDILKRQTAPRDSGARAAR